MKTYRDVISDIRSDNKLLSVENMITDRTILHSILSVANMIVEQSLSKRKYWQTSSLFTHIPCLEMEEAPLSECCEYTNPCNISKSKLEVPKIGEGVFGWAIQGVFSTDMKKKIKIITPNSYVDILKLKIPIKDVYGWIANGHFYCTNPDTKSVEMFAYITYPLPNEILGSECGCKDNKEREKMLCLNPLDQEFKFIDGRMLDMTSLVQQKLLKTYFNLPLDKSTNQLDETVK